MGTRAEWTVAGTTIDETGLEDRPKLFTVDQWRFLRERLKLTKRETEIAGLICESHTKEAIASRLGVSANTVRMHCRNLFTKLRVHDRVGVVVRLVLANASTREPGDGPRPRQNRPYPFVRTARQS